MDQAAAPSAPALATMDPGYPLRFTIDPAKTSMNRLWGVPLLGIIVRSILAIPVLIALWFVGFAVAFTFLVSWIPILFTGRQAGWVYAVNAAYLDWYARASAYIWLLVGGYPWGGDFGARLELDRGQRFNQLWGIPFIGLWVRSIILIPHYIVLFFLGLGAFILLWLSWIPVLAYGRQADVVVTIVGGYLRWYSRVSAYLLMVASPYPPFRLDE